MAVQYTNITDEDRGLNGPLRELKETQAISQQTNSVAVAYQPPITTFDDGSTLTTNADGSVTATNALFTAAGFAGTGSANDDNPWQIPQPTQSSTIINAASALGNPITPSPNVLDQYASYTYSLSWYALTPAQYTEMSKTAKLDTNNWSLLMQSGGAQAGTNRNKYFNLDYYMDNLEIESSFNANGPSSFTELTFNVTEPNGITLLQNLNRAINDLNKPPAEAAKAQYCMVIRFYGYDAAGNLVTKVSPSKGTAGTIPNAANAVVVKYFPFGITELKFRAANKAVMYEVKGCNLGYKYAQGSSLGSVPFPLELTGETVDDVLNGKTLTASAGADAGDRGAGNTGSAGVKTGPQNPSLDSAQTQALFNTSSAYDSAAGWSA